jgi:hypothetical protein
MTTRLSDLIRLTTGEVSTIYDLERAARVTFEHVPNWYAPRTEKGIRDAYFANIDNGNSGSIEISKIAYLHRTGHEITDEDFGRRPFFSLVEVQQ